MEPTVYFVIPCYNEEAVLPETTRRLTEKQKDLLRQFEESTTGKEYDNKKSFMDRVKELFN